MALSSRGTPGRGEVRLRFDPAGLDADLRMVLLDLPAGRWLSMRDLLARTDRSLGWGQWVARTQVLGAAAAGTDVVRAWRAEEPDSADASVMHARVAVERTARAHRMGHPDVLGLWEEAIEACRVAAYTAPADPVPWVCLLALAQLDERQEVPEHRLPSPDPLLATGPWDVLGQVERRDPGNREAYHRMMALMASRADGSWGQAHQFVRWALDRAPRGSALLVLPLYVRVGLWRDQHGPGRELDMYWAGDYAVQDAERALHDWFDVVEPAGHPSLSVLDLSHLAHALWAAHRFDAAARVFTAMGPSAATRPWVYRADDPRRPAEDAATEWIVRARAQCGAPVHGDPRGGPRR
ncbi:hypothetical protein [Streptomyces sp. I05A-00742]|uniref:hypothetical protein n=1 Tax=Streptomyces sp. I05A-00742 TaxID=2732853 RepID=UPI0014882CEC|nr:hypothetical protein [Streptomyces sp. I05A-00742]